MVPLQLSQKNKNDCADPSDVVASPLQQKTRGRPWMPFHKLPVFCALLLEVFWWFIVAFLEMCHRWCMFFSDGVYLRQSLWSIVAPAAPRWAQRQEGDRWRRQSSGVYTRKVSWLSIEADARKNCPRSRQCQGISWEVELNHGFYVLICVCLPLQLRVSWV